MKETTSDKIHKRHTRKGILIIVLLLAMLVNGASASCISIIVDYGKSEGNTVYLDYNDTLPRGQYINSLLWDFGDKTSASGNAVNGGHVPGTYHSYPDPGSYNVKLTGFYTDSNGKQSCTATKTVHTVRSLPKSGGGGSGGGDGSFDTIHPIHKITPITSLQ